MNMMHNPEVRRSLWADIAITIGVSAFNAVFGTQYIIPTLVTCVVCFSFSFGQKYKRYKSIYNLSSEIDRVLYGNEYISFDKYKEGELASLESELAKLTVKLRESSDALQKDKLLLSDSLADISHQLKTPLTSMNIIATMLGDHDLTYERRIELTKDLSRLLNRTDWLINTLLRISKLDANTVAFQPERMSVASLISASADPIAIPMELQEQKLILEIPDDTYLSADRQWTIEAISNILKNCMEHVGPGGEIRVNAAENMIFTQITIIDNGCGIDKADIDHLFERFYKGKNSSSASVGIGLALSKMIITNQNGTIKAGNNPDKGAYFNIRFYKSTF